MPARPLLPFQCLLLGRLRRQGEPCTSFCAFERHYMTCADSTVRHPVTKGMSLFVVRLDPFRAVNAKSSLARKDGIGNLANVLQFEFVETQRKQARWFAEKLTPRHPLYIVPMGISLTSLISSAAESHSL